MNLATILCLAALGSATASTADGAIRQVNSPSSDITEEDLAAAKKALESLNKFVDMFHPNMFDESSPEEVAEVAFDFMTYVTIAIKIAEYASKKPGKESAELKFMRHQFALVHGKLDAITLQLDEVKRLIEWQTTRGMFAQYESFIKATSHLLDDFISADSEPEREVLKRQFLTAFQLNPLAPLKLYQAIVETDFVVSSNLAAAVVHYTQGHRRHVMSFLLSLQRMILRGAQLQIAFEQLQHGESAAHVTKSRWDARMTRLLSRMQIVEFDVKNRFVEHLEASVDRIVSDNRALSNQQFSVDVHKLLSDKFDWLRWLVMALHGRADEGGHGASFCAGVRRLQTAGGRDVVLASSNPRLSRFSLTRAQAALDAAQVDGLHTMTTGEGWTDLIRTKIGRDCRSAAFVGAVCNKNCVHHVTADPKHLAYRMMTYWYRKLVKKNMHTYAFG